MPAKDIYHDAVKQALQKDGWTITQDPFVLGFKCLERRQITDFAIA